MSDKFRYKESGYDERQTAVRGRAFKWAYITAAGVAGHLLRNGRDMELVRAIHGLRLGDKRIGHSHGLHLH